MTFTNQHLLDLSRAVERRLIAERQPIDHESGRIKSEISGSGPIRTIVGHTVQALRDMGFTVFAPAKGDARKYRGWQLSHIFPPIPVREMDWCATHPDYDGEGDNRIVYGATPEAVEDAIDGWHQENEDEEA